MFFRSDFTILTHIYTETGLVLLCSNCAFMSPVSPVFHTVVTARIGLKTQLEHLAAQC